MQRTKATSIRKRDPSRQYVSKRTAIVDPNGFPDNDDITGMSDDSGFSVRNLENIGGGATNTHRNAVIPEPLAPAASPPRSTRPPAQTFDDIFKMIESWDEETPIAPQVNGNFNKFFFKQKN